ncbi:MAG: hypothetical protein RBQ77_02460 [Candidatus Methanomethylophilaceae archaeon]|nr:hypothetical protein [Candidatus Methanomethylophilaceae archaeon]
MLFNKSKNVPEPVASAGLSKWYEDLTDQDRIRLGRYLGGADASSPAAFFVSVMRAADLDENYAFAASISDHALSLRLDPYERFTVAEASIDPLIGAGRTREAKELCLGNLEAYPSVKDIVDRGPDGFPCRLECRNRLIDIMVGEESDYDGADAMLERFFGMGLISAEELSLRRQSLKVRRLQRVFDSIFTLNKKEGQ